MRAMRFAAGVATSVGGFGGPTAPASENPEPSDSVHIDSVVRYLHYSILKVHIFRTLPLYILLLGVVIVAWLLATDAKVKDGNALVTEVVMDAGSLESLTTVSTVYDYLRAVVSSFALLRKNDPAEVIQLYPLGVLALRQFRTTPFEWEAVAVPDSIRKTISPVRFRPYNPKHLDTAPLLGFFVLDNGTVVESGDKWVSNCDLPDDERYDGKSFRIRHTTIRDRCEQYVELLRLADGEAALQHRLDHLERVQFLREGAQLLSIDAALFHPMLRAYYFATVVVEFSAVGRINVQAESTATAIWGPLSALGVGEIILSLSLFAGFVWLCYEYVFRYRLLCRLGLIRRGQSWKQTLYNLVTNIEYYDLIVISLLLAWIAVRFHVVAVSQQTIDAATPSEGNVTRLTDGRSAVKSTTFRFQDKLGTLGYWEVVEHDIAGWATLMLALRALMYLSFTLRFSVVTETVMSAANDLAGVVLTFVVVFTAFVVSSTILYGPNIPEYTDVLQAGATLFRMTTTGQFSDYDRLEEVRPWTTPFFFLFYFIITWLVLLNVIVGILASSFGAVVETYNLVRRPKWTIVSLTTDIRKLFWRIRGKSIAWFSRKYRGDSSVEAGSRAQRPLPSAFQDTMDTWDDDQETAGSGAVGNSSVLGGSELNVPYGGRTDSMTSLDRNASVVELEDTTLYVSQRLRTADAILAIRYPDPKDAQHQQITLRQLQRVTSDFMTSREAKQIFYKSQQQIGTSDGKARQLQGMVRSLNHTADVQRKMVGIVGKTEEVYSRFFADADEDCVEAVDHEMLLLRQLISMTTDANVAVGALESGDAIQRDTKVLDEMTAKLDGLKDQNALLEEKLRGVLDDEWLWQGMAAREEEAKAIEREEYETELRRREKRK